MQSARIVFIPAAVFLSCSLIFTASSNVSGSAAKPPEVEVLEMSLARKDGLIEIDTTVRNLGPKPIAGFTAVYHFFAFDHKPVTTKKTKLDEAVLAPGAEGIIRAQVEEPPRAITVEFEAVDMNGHEYRVKNGGPFPIE